jgi:hypothetical protein
MDFAADVVAHPIGSTNKPVTHCTHSCLWIQDGSRVPLKLALGKLDDLNTRLRPYGFDRRAIPHIKDESSPKGQMRPHGLERRLNIPIGGLVPENGEHADHCIECPSKTHIPNVTQHELAGLGTSIVRSFSRQLQHRR